MIMIMVHATSWCMPPHGACHQHDALIDHIALISKLMHGGGKGKDTNLLHCGKEKYKICALALPTMHHFGD